MKYEILQSSTTDCGFTCLKVLLANLNNDENYLLLENKKGTRYSFLDLINIGNKHDLELKGYQIDDLDLLSSFSLPLICQIKKNKSEHIVILNKIRKNHYYLFDPSVGNIILNEDEFGELFMGNILIINNIHKKKCELKKEQVNKNIIFSLIMNLLSSISFLCSLLFIVDYLLFVVFLALGINFIFLQKIFNENFVKSINDKYSVSYDNLGVISQYQSYIISKITSFPSKIIIIIFMLIMMVNSYSFGYLSALMAIIFILLNYYIHQEYRYTGNKIEFMEQNHDDLKKINRLTNSYSSKLLLTTLSFALFMALFIVFMMQISGHIGIDFFIFQFSLIFTTFIMSRDIFDFDIIRQTVYQKELQIKEVNRKK